MATEGRVYTPTFDDAPNNRHRIVTRSDAAAGDLTALGSDILVVIVDVDSTVQGGKIAILDALAAVTRRISRDWLSMTSPSGADTVSGATHE
jgi:hypothetical protein